MWNSQSRVTKDGTKYDLNVLEGMIHVLGFDLQREGDPLETFPKDELCEIHYSAYLNGITNGEYLYGVYEVFKDLLADYPSTVAPLFKEAILCSLYDQWRELFLDKVKQGHAGADDRGEVWKLYVAASQNLKAPLWVDDDDDKEVAPPKLEAMTGEDWSRVFERIYNEFFWDRDWEIFKTFALEEPQPHWPSFQEYRKAIRWLEHLLSQTSTNRKERGRGPFLVVDPILKR